MYVAIPVDIAEAQITNDWKDINGLEQLKKLLTNFPDSVIEIKNIVNFRTAKDYRLLQLLNTANPNTLLSEIKNEVEDITEGIHPDLFWEFGESLNYTTHIRWTTDGTDGLFDVVFIPVSQKLIIPRYSLKENSKKDIYDFVKKTVLKNEIYISNEVIQNWKENLNEVLPIYMVPEDFIALKKLPLTANAKIDIKALPKPQPKKISEKANEPGILTKNEQIILDIWSESLGLENLKPSDDFFELGGHSLLAVKVMVAIEKETGKRLPLATLFDNSTIRKLAKQLDNGSVQKWDVLVPIKTTGKKNPIFLIHGGGLNILLFKSISAYFDDEQPVYGMQALGLNHKTDIPSSMKEIGKRYIKEILEVNPEGPYALAGYSLGGFIAFEIARQLKEMGKNIKFLGIMDTYAGNNYYVGNKLIHTFQKIKRQFYKVPFFTKSFISSPKETIEYQLLITKKKMKQLRSSDEVIAKDILTDYEMEIYKKYSKALDAYVLTPFDVGITLFRVEKRLYYLDDPVYLGWNNFALKGVNIQQVPGDHKTFLYSPNSKQFAGIIQKVLDDGESN